jgi:hypothetical protein
LQNSSSGENNSDVGGGGDTLMGEDCYDQLSKKGDFFCPQANAVFSLNLCIQSPYVWIVSMLSPLYSHKMDQEQHLDTFSEVDGYTLLLLTRSSHCRD